MAEKINTSVGEMWVRNEFDKNVVKEVITDHEYERWGEINIFPGNLVLDCGAHIGSFSKLALVHGATVLAIEPDEENFKMLIRNTQNQKGITLFKALLGNGKPMPFLVDKDRGELNKIDKKGKLQPTISLDEVIEVFEIKKIDLLKMDIEGSEYEVLYNFKHLDLVKQLTMEWHYSQVKMSELIIYLDKNGLKTVWSAGNYGWGKIQAKRE